MFVLPKVKFHIAIKNAFKNYSNFKGRIRRSEYWFFMLFVNFFTVFFLTMFLLCELKVIGYTTEYYYEYWQNYYRKYNRRDYAMYDAFLILLCIYISFITLPTLSATVRRLHDTGRRGEYIFAGLVPFFGGLTLLILLCYDSNKEGNEFGPSPKYTNASPIENQPPLINSSSGSSYSPNMIISSPDIHMNNTPSYNNNDNLIYNNMNKPGAPIINTNNSNAPVMYLSPPVNNQNMYQNK